MELDRNSYESETTAYEGCPQQAGVPSALDCCEGPCAHAAPPFDRVGAHEDERQAVGDVPAASECSYPAHEEEPSECGRGVVDATGEVAHGASAASPSSTTQASSCDAYPDTELDEDNCAAHNTYLGRRGEEAAVRYLEAHGYEILERNWKCCAGEADIIAFDEDDLVFIEVKTRSNLKLGLPCEAVDKQKRRRYEIIAALYLQDFDRSDLPVRFDVIGILVTGRDRALLRHHVNAFALAS